MYGTYCGRILFKDGADKLQNNKEARVDDSPRHFSTAQLNFAHGFDHTLIPKMKQMRNSVDAMSHPIRVNGTPY